MVLPSNDSLHEDLILEELEVFQVSAASLPLHTFVTSCSVRSKRNGGREGVEPTVAGGVQELWC